MKRMTFILMAFLCPYLSISQTDTLRQQLNTLFGALNASQVPSGYLAPYGMEMADKADFNGVISDSNIVNSMDALRLVYADVYTSRFYSGAPVLPFLDNLNTDINGAGDNDLVLFYGQYSDIREDAVQLNLLSYSGGRLYDVAGFYNSYNNNDLRKQLWYYNNGTASDPILFSGKWTSASQNLPVVRLAEMYLIRAETNLRLVTSVGDTPANDLAQIRNPARVNLPVIAAPTLADILRERQLELAFEGVRIHDIKRLKGSTGTFAWNDDLLVFPIPAQEVSASGEVIVQNPGY